MRLSDELVIAVLCAIYDKCNFSTNCHIPPEAILKSFPSEIRGIIKKAIRLAQRKGLIYRKGGTKSYGLTKEALLIVREKCVEE